MRIVVVGSALLSLLAVSPSIAIEDCTAADLAKQEELQKAQPAKCVVQLGYFGSCDDDCYEAYKKSVPETPNCATPGAPRTLAVSANLTVTLCEQGLADAANRYMPLATTGLSQCSATQSNAWNATFGETTTCESKNPTCTDSCLKILEESVLKAPACSDESGYWFGEAKKAPLVQCLKSRGESFKVNDVVYSTVNSKGEVVVRGNATTPGTNTTQGSNSTNPSTDGDVTTPSPNTGTQVPAATTKAPSSGSMPTTLSLGFVVATVSVLAMA